MNLTSGIAHADVNGTFRNFENVIASDEGGRIVGTEGANVVTLGEGTDDIVLAGGDDRILANGDTLNVGDLISGGAGDDTLVIDGEDNFNLGAIQANAGDIDTLEHVLITGTSDDDVTLTMGEIFGARAAGIESITIQDIGGDNTVVVTTAAAMDLSDVSFVNVQTLDLAAGAGGVEVTANTFDGVEAVDVATTTTINIDEGGTFDWSGITFTTVTTVAGGVGDTDTLVFGADLGSITTIGTGTGTDTVTFAGVDVADISAGAFTAVEVLNFGSATIVSMDHNNNGGTQFTSVIGTAGTTDILVLEGGGTNAAGGAVAYAADSTIRGVETIVIDNQGAATTFTTFEGLLESGVTVVGDSVGGNTLILGDDDADLAGIAFVNFGTLDVATFDVTLDSVTLAGFEDGVDIQTGTVTITDSVTLDGVATGAAEVEVEATTFTLGEFNATTGSLEVTMTASADTVTISDDATFAAGELTINMGGGNDVLIDLEGDASATAATGGTGTDTYRIVAQTAAAGDFAAITGFEILEAHEASATAFNLTLNNTDNFQTIDLSRDTNTTGANVIDLTANTTVTTVIGGSGSETITLVNSISNVNAGAGDDNIVVTGNATAGVINSYVLTLGAGDDEVTVGAGIKSSTPVAADSDNIIINDFVAGDDLIDVSALGANAITFVLQGVTQAVVDAADPQSLAAAIVAAESAFNVPAGGTPADIDFATAFIYDGNTYVLLGDGIDGYIAGNDLIITLIGEHNLTATNFVLV